MKGASGRGGALLIQVSRPSGWRRWRQQAKDAAFYGFIVALSGFALVCFVIAFSPPEWVQ